ncbi:hypothetical protein HanPI659440_Chr16g0656191 [Helianthus annuus]|nr:hypothetical protein HanPI659440_Chr16g0656191 [Helianthus annuus]
MRSNSHSYVRYILGQLSGLVTLFHSGPPVMISKGFLVNIEGLLCKFIGWRYKRL